jgi:hypothetical protein
MIYNKQSDRPQRQLQTVARSADAVKMMPANVLGCKPKCRVHHGFR